MTVIAAVGVAAHKGMRHADLVLAGREVGDFRAVAYVVGADTGFEDIVQEVAQIARLLEEV